MKHKRWLSHLWWLCTMTKYWSRNGNGFEAWFAALLLYMDWIYRGWIQCLVVGSSHAARQVHPPVHRCVWLFCVTYERPNVGSDRTTHSDIFPYQDGSLKNVSTRILNSSISRSFLLMYVGVGIRVVWADNKEFRFVLQTTSHLASKFK